MDEILISVLMGVRYHSSDTSLLARSVGSILAQSAAALELLVCDDGSSEPARRLLERIARQDCRRRLIRQGGLLELPAKLNACLRASAGSWIARMDDDDFASPLRFARQIAFLEAAPGIAFAGSNALLIRDGQPAGVRVFPEWPAVKDFADRFARALAAAEPEGASTGSGQREGGSVKNTHSSLTACAAGGGMFGKLKKSLHYL